MHVCQNYCIPPKKIVAYIATFEMEKEGKKNKKAVKSEGRDEKSKREDQGNKERDKREKERKMEMLKGEP